MSCQTCRHWAPVLLDDHDDEPTRADATKASPEDRAAAVWGTCTLIGADHDGHEGSAARANPQVAAYTSDGSDYWSALHTRPTFGCTEEAS